jgi:uncharacterized protein (TIGR02594 family)
MSATETQTDSKYLSIPWYDIAEKEIGVKEEPGSGNNPRVIEYHSATSLKSKKDATAWCAAFMCWVLMKAGYKHTKSAWARDYLKYGEKLSKPIKGCIMVFERNGKGGDSHVTLWSGKETETHYLCCGGNQGDQVKLSLYAKKDLLGCRWPVKENE